MLLKTVFSTFMVVLFALPFGQVADIAHAGQIKTSKREQKRSGLNVSVESPTDIVSVAKKEAIVSEPVSLVPQTITPNEDPFLYSDVSGQVVTPPPRARA